jgi:hypothetical protein
LDDVKRFAFDSGLVSFMHYDNHMRRGA